MDWFCENGADVLVVPTDQELSCGLPSPKSLCDWEMISPPTFGLPNKFDVIDDKDGKFITQKRCTEAEMQHSTCDAYLSGSNMLEESSCGTLPQNIMSIKRPDCQLDLPGADQMDDIFLNSLLLDSPGTETLNTAHCSRPLSNRITLPSENSSFEGVDSESSSRSTSSSLMGHIDGGVTAREFVSCNTKQNAYPPPEISQESGAYDNTFEEATSPEAYVLWELEMGMMQLTKKMRICFRDALYRLADNSKLHPRESDHRDSENIAEIPPTWRVNDKFCRSSNGVKELETNVFDRAIASIMYNNMDFNLQDYPAKASAYGAFYVLP